MNVVDGRSHFSPKMWSLLYASFALLVVTGATWAVTAIVRAWNNPLNKVPGPWLAKWTNLPLKLAIITGRRMYYVHNLHETYGPYVRLTPTEVSTSDPNSFSQIHRIGSGFLKSQWYLDMVILPRPAVFTMKDPKDHARRRKLLARAFSKSELRQHCEAIVMEKVKLAVSKMRDEASAGVADALKWWTLMATDVSVHLMFGESFHMIEKGRTDIYIQTLQSALQGGGIGYELPLLRVIGRMLPIPIFRRMFNSAPYLMDQAKVAINNGRQHQKTLFSLAIQEADKGEKLDDLDVHVEAAGLIVAGSDTTAVSLTYFTWVVLSRPSLQEQLEQEAAKLPADYCDADTENLELLNAVIEETLRLYGAAPGGLPRTVPSGGITMGEYFFPDGTTVTTQGYTFHRDPNLFPNPYVFDHTRWLNNGEALSPLAKAVYHPFGAGSRVCLGIHLARTELRLGAVEFLRQCKGVRLAPSTTDASMEMDNFFLVAPSSHKCEIVL